MPPAISSQTKAFFMMTLWLTVKNPSLVIVKDPTTGEITPKGVVPGSKQGFLDLLSSVAEGGPSVDVATQLYEGVLAEIPAYSNTDVSAQLDDGTTVKASIRYAEALQVVHELVGRIATGDFAVGQVADYDTGDGCQLSTIEGAAQ